MKIAMITLVVILQFWVFGLFALNHMDLILSIQGAHENSLAYKKMAAIDFNADGYDDLIIPQNRSTPLSVFAKIFCYFGGPTFDGIPDLEYQGEFWNQDPGARLLSGDFNGDGYQDIVDSVALDETTLQMGLRFYYGGPGADLIPDHIIPMASLGNPFSSEFMIKENIGDVNNDGCDDIGAYRCTPDSLQTWSIAIIFGGTFHSVTVVDSIYGGGVAYISYLGDVNGDGIDDFSAGYDINQNPQYFRYLFIYYGNDGFWDPLDRTLMFEDNSYPYIFPYAFGIGDFNRDGYDDFLMNWVVDVDSGDKITLGSETLPQSQEFVIDTGQWTDLINVYYREVNFGDFNGDGYSDMITSDHESGFWHGAACLWLGKANPNGLYDLRIPPPPVSPWYQFGWGMPAVGDFNGDGCDDVAFCAPQSQSGTSNYNGWVHVYAGNTQLADTTVANDDPISPSVKEQLQLRISPNPVRNTGFINMEVSLNAKTGNEPILIDIYNQKGQLMHKTEITNTSSRTVSSSVDLAGYSSGVYLCKITSGKQSAISRFSIVK